MNFSRSIFRALRLMHIHLNGAFTSPTGTSLSAGNLTPDPKIYDYETVRIPQLGDAEVAREYQHADLVHAFSLVLHVVERLSSWPVLTECLTTCFEAYQNWDNDVVFKIVSGRWLRSIFRTCSILLLSNNSVVIWPMRCSELMTSCNYPN